MKSSVFLAAIACLLLSASASLAMPPGLAGRIGPSNSALVAAPAAGEPSPDSPGDSKCLDLEDHSHSSPFALKGKLILTYVEPTIDKSKGDNHELGIFDLAHPESKVRR